MRRRLPTPLLALVAALPGCFVDFAPTPSHDPSSSSTAEPASTGETTTGAVDPNLVDPPGTSTTSTSTTDTTGDATTIEPTTASAEQQACIDEAKGDACDACLCSECFTAHHLCQADPGCVAIMACADEHGCTGLDCLGPCLPVIDANCGPGKPSALLALALSGCFSENCSDCAP